MTFYIKPPDGNISLKKLHQDAEIRLRVLHEIHEHLHGEDEMSKIFTKSPSLALYSECLIDGSSRDRISHFILRLSSLKSRSFQTFLIDAETSLFKYRIISGGVSALKQSLVNLKRHATYALKHQTLSYHHRELMQHIQKAISHLCSSGMLQCQNRSSCHSIVVPWTMVNPMVRDRLVPVISGKVQIHCHLLTAFLCIVFRDVVKYGIEELLSLTSISDTPLSDSRMNAVKMSLKLKFFEFSGGRKLLTPLNLLHNDIAHESRLFPLCMQRLHLLLNKTNRLGHHARLRYTLFLKDIGLPVNENMTFWEQFYSKPQVGNTTGCCHSWSGTSRNRYIYSIRHVYGLEGGRINYTSHSCSALQGLNSQPSEMSGCPFSGWDQEEIHSTLRSFYGDQLFLRNVMQQVKEGKPSHACKILMRYSLQSLGFSSSKLTNVNLVKETASLSGNDSPTLLDINIDRKGLSAEGMCVNTNIELGEETEALVEGNCDSDTKGSCHAAETRIVDIQMNSSPLKPKGAVLNDVICLKSSSSDEKGNMKENLNICTALRHESKCCSQFSNHKNCSMDSDKSSCKQDSAPRFNCISGLCQPGPANTRQPCGSLPDIEDAVFISNCNFHRPSQYYLKMKEFLGTL